MFDIVITRHKELVSYLKELNVIDENVVVVEHATPDIVKNKKVVGVLPHSLSCLTELFCEVPLFIPQEMRGKNLTIEQIKEYAQPLQTYKVRKVE